jgi:hypothetical protein
MGADFLYSLIPACGLDEKRKLELQDIIDAMSFKDLVEVFDYIAVGENKDDKIRVARRRVRCALTALNTEERSVAMLRLPGLEFPYLLTGGMSWGDEPTSTYPDFEVINACDKLYNKLAEWAKKDASIELKSCN